MKRWIIYISVAILFIGLLATFFTGGFKKGILSERIYRPQNVYEEIWNLVLTEQKTSKQTVLTSATKDAVLDFDFGFDFVGIHIPECNLTIGWRRTEDVQELSFLFSLGQGEYAHFIYNYEAKTLFGNTDFSYLMENFLTDYFAWCTAAADFSSAYCLESLGDFAFQYENPIYNRKLSS